MKRSGWIFAVRLLTVSCVAAWLLLALAWPTTLYLCGLSATFYRRAPVAIQAVDGPWYEVTRSVLVLRSGTITFYRSTVDLDDDISHAVNPKLDRLGLTHGTAASVSAPPLEIEITPPLDIGTELGFRWEDGRDFGMAAPLWLLATVISLAGLIVFGFGRVLPTWRRRTRLQTGLCLHCNYNLAGVEADACPECGAKRPMATIAETTDRRFGH